MIGYGVIRCFVEGLRTDSLYLMPGVRVSQVLSGCLILLGVLFIGIIVVLYTSPKKSVYSLLGSLILAFDFSVLV